MTTTISTAIASITVIVTSLFGNVPVDNAQVSNATSTTISTSYQQPAQQVNSEPIVVCGSGGLVPANAPKCPKK